MFITQLLLTEGFCFLNYIFKKAEMNERVDFSFLRLSAPFSAGQFRARALHFGARLWKVSPWSRRFPRVYRSVSCLPVSRVQSDVLGFLLGGTKLPTRGSVALCLGYMIRVRRHRCASAFVTKNSRSSMLPSAFLSVLLSFWV